MSTVSAFSLRTGRPLLERVCTRLGIEPGRHEEREFEDGEHKIRPMQDVRGHDVYVVESLYGDADLTVDRKLVRTLFFLAALRDAGAARTTLVAPYLCYARKDRRTQPRDPVTSRYVATLVEAVGVDRILTVDVHNEAAYQNAFRIPSEHLTAADVFVDACVPLVTDASVAVVSPDAGGIKRAEHFRERLALRLGRSVDLALVEKFRGGGAVRGGRVVGEVRNRVVIVVDDLISSGSTLAHAAGSCRAHGADTVYAAATHGVFSPDAGRTLRDSALRRVLVLDTIAPRAAEQEFLRERIVTLGCAPLIADAIRVLHGGRSSDRRP